MFKIRNAICKGSLVLWPVEKVLACAIFDFDHVVFKQSLLKLGVPILMIGCVAPVGLGGLSLLYCLPLTVIGIILVWLHFKIFFATSET